ncbi:MAG: MATE family efflux transporter [Dysgonamonadaceae bacterium]|jgi:putative MATE family efflux protein|nr:MATE family efflux transporter [Dysgonamonadaceae bacterium]
MKSENAPLALGTEPVGKLLIQYAVPAIIAMTAASLYNITDSIFIGHGVGPLALSGLAISFPLMNLSAAFATLTGIGGSTLLSIRLGQKDYDTANNILGNVITLNIIVGLAYSVIVSFFLNPILYFFGASPDTLPYAHDFMQIILCGNIVTYLFFGLNAVLRSSGSPQKAMFATIFTVLINIVLNPLFVFKFGWGIRGSASATVISQTLVLIWQMRLFSDKNNFIHLKKGIYKLKKKIVKDALSIGLAPFLMNSAACVIVVLINHGLINNGGDLAVGAYGIVNRVAFLFAMIVMGFNQGMQPIAGYNYGARLNARVIKVLKFTIICATIVMSLGFTVVQLFPRTVASIFTTDEALTNFAVVGLRYVFTFYPLVGLQMVTSTFFQSIEKPGQAIFMSLTRQVIFLIPLLLILPGYWGINGVWLSMPIADCISITLASVLLIRQLRKLKTEQVS